MKSKNSLWSLCSGVLTGGISYWFNPYNSLTVWGIPVYLLIGTGAFLGSFILVLVLSAPPVKTSIWLWGVQK